MYMYTYVHVYLCPCILCTCIPMYLHRYRCRYLGTPKLHKCRRIVEVDFFTEILLVEKPLIAIIGDWGQRFAAGIKFCLMGNGFRIRGQWRKLK